jgi:hypothetical protein
MLFEAEQLAYVREIVIIDDGSIENLDRLASAYPKVRLVYSPFGAAVGRALKSGIRQAHNHAIMIFNAECGNVSDRTSELISSLAHCDAVVGIPQTTEPHWFQGLCTKSLNWWASYLSGNQVRTEDFDFCAVRYSVVSNWPSWLPNDSAFFPTVLMALSRRGARITYQVSRGSAQQSHRPAGQSINMAAKLTYWGILLNPMRVLAPICLILFILNLAIILRDVKNNGRVGELSLFTSAGFLLFLFFVWVIRMTSEYLIFAFQRTTHSGS